MKTSQLIHQTRLEDWTMRLQDHAASGLSVKEWCSLNNVSIHQYHYWKRLLKDEAVSSMLPDIVQVRMPAASSPSPQSATSLLHNSHNLCNHCVSPSIVIRGGSFTIEVSETADPALLEAIIKAVDHA